MCSSLEEFIPFAGTESLVVILKTFSKSWMDAINDRMCYHLLLKTLQKCQEDLHCNDSEIQDFMEDFLCHMDENLEYYLTQQHAQNIIRVYISLAAGIQLIKQPHTSKLMVAFYYS